MNRVRMQVKPLSGDIFQPHLQDQPMGVNAHVGLGHTLVSEFRLRYGTGWNDYRMYVLDEDLPDTVRAMTTRLSTSAKVRLAMELLREVVPLNEHEQQQRLDAINGRISRHKREDAETARLLQDPEPEGAGT